MDNEEVRAQVLEVSAYTPENKADLVHYFKRVYGEKKWTGQAAMAVSGSTDKSSKAYRAAIRPFQGERLLHDPATPTQRKGSKKAYVNPKAAETARRYRELGETLTDYKPPEDGYYVSFGLWLVISGDCPKDAEWRDGEMYIIGAAAEWFLENPSLDSVLALYFYTDDMTKEDPPEGEPIAFICDLAGESWVMVSAAS